MRKILWKCSMLERKIRSAPRIWDFSKRVLSTAKNCERTGDVQRAIDAQVTGSHEFLRPNLPGNITARPIVACGINRNQSVHRVGDDPAYRGGSLWNVCLRATSEGVQQEAQGRAARVNKKLNAREPDPDNPLLNVLSGEQRVNGIQLSVTGRITDRWQVLSSYAYLDGKLASSQFYAQAVGAQLANVPRHTFNLWTTFALPWKLTAGAGTQFVDSRTASTTAPTDAVTGLVKQIPGYWLFNAMASHPLGERVDLQLNLYNLADQKYFDEIHPAHIVPGAGFTALVGLNFKF
jgi:hypothetical protein